MDSCPWKTSAEVDKTAVNSLPWIPASGLEKQAAVDGLAEEKLPSLDSFEPIHMGFPQVITDADITFPEGGRGCAGL
ncbi:hypothetical protein FRC02_009687 [Tulasnella sp. 418]|nr:hypothetical protein FRC02_009687 [Tulasnella sp. 418]